MDKVREIKIEIPSGTISALTWGPTNGKPILALHGWLDNAASFIPIAKYFSDFKFIAVDLIGHGHSSHPAPSSYFHYIDYVADAAAILDKLEWETCGVLGHSLGAGIATILTGTIPERITALGLIDGIGPITIDESQEPDLLRKALVDYAKLPSKKLTVYRDITAAVDARLAVSKMSKDAVELLVERGIKKAHGGYTWRSDPRLKCGSLLIFNENQIPPFIKRITSPTCLIRPSHGWPFDEKVFAERIKYLHDVEVHKVTGDHHVHMDDPDTVGPILSEFFVRNL